MPLVTSLAAGTVAGDELAGSGALLDTPAARLWVPPGFTEHHDPVHWTFGADFTAAPVNATSGSTVAAPRDGDTLSRAGNPYQGMWLRVGGQWLQTAPVVLADRAALFALDPLGLKLPAGTSIRVLDDAGRAQPYTVLAGDVVPIGAAPRAAPAGYIDNTTAYVSWRLKLYETTTGATNFCINELEFRTTRGQEADHRSSSGPDGVQVELTDGWYDKTSAVTSYWEAQNAFNKIVGHAADTGQTNWHSNGGTTDVPTVAPHHLGAHFPDPARVITEIYLRAPLVGSPDRWQQMPARFDVEASHDQYSTIRSNTGSYRPTDEGNWTLIRSFSGVTWTTPGEEQVFPI